MILTNCNCGEKVDCGCVLSFSSYIQNSVSVLDVGTLEGGTCSFEEYVIDWYRNGQHAMVSGVGYDPDIEAFHPFTGNSAIPVLSGTYVPVVRYVVISGEQIFFEKKQCHKWCDVVQDLPAITVSALNCGSSNITGLYQFQISYSNIEPVSLPARRLTWNLPSDLSTKYFAVEFIAYDIADKIEIFFKDENNILTAWIAGSSVSTNYTELPYRYWETAYNKLKFVIELPDYADGDFLIIKITPSVLQPEITETSWVARFKCLTTFPDCNVFDGVRIFDVLNYSFVYNEGACRWELRIPFGHQTIRSSNSPYYRFYEYAGIREGSMNSAASYIHPDGYFINAGISFNKFKNGLGDSYYASSYSTRYASVDNVNLIKTGNVFVWTFDSESDYLDILNRYNESKNSDWYNNFVDDLSDINYYRWWHWRFKERPINCGDNPTSATRALYFHIKSTIVFESSGGVHTLTITAFEVASNEWSSESCNSVVSTINSTINSAKSMINAADYDENTYCYEYKMFGNGIGYKGEYVSVSDYTHGGVMVRLKGNNVHCFDAWMNDGLLCNGLSVTGYYYHYYFVGKIDLEKDPETGDFYKDEFGNYIDEPTENFSLYDGINPSTQCNSSSIVEDRLLLRVENGVITFPT
jgi:hypothetical protein